MGTDPETTSLHIIMELESDRKEAEVGNRKPVVDDVQAESSGASLLAGTGA